MSVTWAEEPSQLLTLRQLVIGSTCFAQTDSPDAFNSFHQIPVLLHISSALISASSNASSVAWSLFCLVFFFVFFLIPSVKYQSLFSELNYSPLKINDPVWLRGPGMTASLTSETAISKTNYLEFIYEYLDVEKPIPTQEWTSPLDSETWKLVLIACAHPCLQLQCTEFAPWELRALT